MNFDELAKTRPVLLDAYDGVERTPERQKAHDAHLQAMLESAPDHIKLAIAERKEQLQAEQSSGVLLFIFCMRKSDFKSKGRGVVWKKQKRRLFLCHFCCIV